MATNASQDRIRKYAWSFMSLALGASMIACDSGSPEGVPQASTSAAVIAVAASEAASTSSFTATISGDVVMALAGEDVIAGAKYQRYHINMVSKDPNGVLPAVVIAFGNTDMIAPSVGTYQLGGKDGFRGSVEIYSKPQRDFQIISGELIITDARGDVLTGSFSLSAKETPEEYGDPIGLIKVEGEFISTPVKK